MHASSLSAASTKKCQRLLKLEEKQWTNTTKIGASNIRTMKIIVNNDLSINGNGMTRIVSSPCNMCNRDTKPTRTFASKIWSELIAIIKNTKEMFAIP